jgi:hypothetical protein
MLVDLLTEELMSVDVMHHEEKSVAWQEIQPKLSSVVIYMMEASMLRVRDRECFAFIGRQ